MHRLSYSNKSKYTQNVFIDRFKPRFQANSKLEFSKSPKIKRDFGLIRRNIDSFSEFSVSKSPQIIEESKDDESWMARIKQQMNSIKDYHQNLYKQS